jgi:DNA helicase-2/ATP-dependent DNA helicase PcrA
MLKPVRQNSGELPWRYEVFDSRSQANEILRLINEKRALGFRYGDIAVLYRSHFQSIDVQMTLARMKIPFRITSGVGVFEQVHVKDILSYLRLIVNPGDELSFLRLIQLLPGVGDKSSRAYWDKLSCRFDASRKEDRDALHGMLAAKAKPVWVIVSKCLEAAYDHLAEGEVGEIIEDFCDLFYEDYLHEEWEEHEAEERLDDIKELAAQIAGAENGLQGFLADVALLTNLDVRRNDPQQDRVTLSTIHQAKGMEWPVVLVPWLSEGLFPSAKAVEEGRQDEERRLFYVVVTRAKDCLYMFSPQIRKLSDGGMMPVGLSTFVKEIPNDLIHLRRVASAPQAFQSARPYGGGYGGGYGRKGGAYASSSAYAHTSWRR